MSNIYNIELKTLDFNSFELFNLFPSVNRNSIFLFDFCLKECYCSDQLLKLFNLTNDKKEILTCNDLLKRIIKKDRDFISEQLSQGLESDKKEICFTLDFNEDSDYNKLLVKSKFLKFSYSNNEFLIFVVNDVINLDYIKIKNILEKNHKIKIDKEKDCLCFINEDYKIINTNSVFANKLSILKNSLLRKNFLELICDEELDFIKYIFNKTKKDDSVLEMNNHFKTIENVNLRFSSYVCYMKEINLYIIISNMIEETQKIDNEKLQYDKSVEINEIKSDFFTHISHEFKTPLNIILSSLDLLKTKMVLYDEKIYKNEYKKFCEFIKQNSYKMLKLTVNMIDAIKITNGFMKLNPSLCDFQNLIKDIIKTIESYAINNEIEIHFINRTKLNNEIICDIDKIDRIMLNLLSNAIKNSNKDHDIYVTLSENENFYKISIKDNGIGISGDMLPKVFDKFIITGSEFVRNCDGSGIGLSIASSLVEMHNGKIGVKSKLGVGSTFYFTISKKLINDKNVKSTDLLKTADYEVRSIRESRVNIEMSDVIK